MRRNLHHFRAEQLRLVEDFRVDVRAHRPQVEGGQERSVVGSHHAGERREVSFGGGGEESIGRAAEKATNEWNVRRLPVRRIGRRDDDLGVRRPQLGQEQRDVLGPVAEIAIQRHHVVAVAVVERITKRLTQPKIRMVMEHPHVLVVRCEGVRERPCGVATPVVHDHHFPTDKVADAVEIIPNPCQIGNENVSLVVRGDYDGHQGPLVAQSRVMDRRVRLEVSHRSPGIGLDVPHGFSPLQSVTPGAWLRLPEKKRGSTLRSAVSPST
jgi:hypothetical protein